MAAGSRLPGRSVLLLWMVPVTLAVVGVGLAAQSIILSFRHVPGEGEVVRVYDYEDSAPWRTGGRVYAPVFRYIWSDGQPTEATPGMSHTDWNFEIGSRHAITYDPEWKGDVRLPGPHNYAVAAITLVLAAILTLPICGLSWVLARRRAARDET